MSVLVTPLAPIPAWAGQVASGRVLSRIAYGTGPIETIVLPSAGVLYGIGINIGDPITAGEIRVQVEFSVNGLLPTQYAMNAATGTDRFFRVTDPLARFQQVGGVTEQIAFQVEADNTLLPTPTDIFIIPWVILNPGISVDETLVG